MKKISSRISIFALIIGSFLSFSVNAAENPTIATINIDRISKEAKVVKNIAKQISAKRDKFQKGITKQEKKLEKEKDKLEAKKNVLSESALKKEQLKFFKKVEKLKKDATKKDKLLKKAYTTSIKKVNDIVGEVVNDIAKKRGLLVVLPSSQVVFSVKGIDITSQVVVKLDKKISKMKVKFK